MNENLDNRIQVINQRFNNLLDRDMGTLKNFNRIYTYRQYINEDTIETITNGYLDIFKDIEDHALDNVLIEFIEELKRYSFILQDKAVQKVQFGFQKQDEGVLSNDFSRKDFIDIDYTKYKPSREINKDIKIIEEYQRLLRKIYNIEYFDDEVLSGIEIPDYIALMYKENEMIINDLKKREFQVVSKGVYYEIKTKPTDSLECFLKGIRSKYNLQGVSLICQELIRILPKNAKFINY